MKRAIALPARSLATLAGAALFTFASPISPAFAAAPQPLPSAIGDFALKIEPGLFIPLTEPQSGRFKLGGGQTVKALVNLHPYVDLGPRFGFQALPNKTSELSPGVAWTYGLGVRVKRPHESPDGDTFLSASPWVDADALYIRTGSLNRAGFSAGVGVAFPLCPTRTFWLGPFVRYMQIIESSRSGYDDRDAKLLTVGLSLEASTGVRYRSPEPVMCEPKSEVATSDGCLDTDGDTLPDAIDRCPHARGPVDNWGCPPYKRLVIKKDKLELKERIYFAWDQALLQEVSFPALDEVAQALSDNKNFRVQVEGHSSSEGGDDHNQTLSEKRAEAVLDYLVIHGIARDRLVSKGFASTVPVDTNATLLGRENNRRVEFVVNFNILPEGAK